MSNVAPRPIPISIDEYLDGETRTEIKHEYLDGEVVAMGGASAKHGLVAGALHAALIPYARRQGCQLFIADMKVRVDHADQTYFYYPDLLLACDPQDREPYYRRRPCMVVEVLSPSTERIDRREKLFAYQTITSLHEYLLVDPFEADWDIPQVAAISGHRDWKMLQRYTHLRPSFIASRAGAAHRLNAKLRHRLKA